MDVHVVVYLILEIEVGNVLGDRVGDIGEVEAHGGFQELGRSMSPGSSYNTLVPVGIAGYRSRVDDH